MNRKYKLLLLQGKVVVRSTRGCSSNRVPYTSLESRNGNKSAHNILGTQEGLVESFTTLLQWCLGQQEVALRIDSECHTLPYSRGTGTCQHRAEHRSSCTCAVTYYMLIVAETVSEYYGCARVESLTYDMSFLPNCSIFKGHMEAWHKAPDTSTSHTPSVCIESSSQYVQCHFVNESLASTLHLLPIDVRFRLQNR